MMLEYCPVDKLKDRNLNGKNKDKHQFQKNSLAIQLLLDGLKNFLIYCKSQLPIFWNIDGTWTLNCHKLEAKSSKWMWVTIIILKQSNPSFNTVNNFVLVLMWPLDAHFCTKNMKWLWLHTKSKPTEQFWIKLLVWNV